MKDTQNRFWWWKLLRARSINHRKSEMDAKGDEVFQFKPLIFTEEQEVKDQPPTLRPGSEFTNQS